MSIESDLYSVLSGLADGNVFIMAAPAQTQPPYVIYRVLEVDPIMTLQGPEGTSKFTIGFEAYGATFSEVKTLEDATKTAIDAAIATLSGWREPRLDDMYYPDLDEFMRPVVYSFWHSS